MGLLKEGDVIELKRGHTVYFELPEHCIYANRVGVFDQLSKTEVTIGAPKGGLDTSFLVGRYIVTKTASEGGGIGHGPHDTYPDGHCVYCRNDTLPIEVKFYQTGCFTAMIPQIEPIGRARAVWTMEPDTAKGTP